MSSGVRQLKSGKWQARFYDVNHVERAKNFDTKRDAVAWRGEQLSAIRKGNWIDPKGQKTTFKSFAAKWLLNKESLGLKPSTVEGYRELLRNRVGPKWNSFPVGAITVPLFDEWTRSLIAEGLSTSRIDKIQLVVRQILDLAVKERSLGRNPIVTKDIHKPKARRPDPRAFTHDEAKALIATISEPYQLLTEFLCLTGLRMSEVVALKIGDIDFGRKEIKVSRSTVIARGEPIDGSPKSGKSRKVPLTAALVEKLRSHTEGKRKTDWLFTTADGAQMLADSYRGAFKKAVTAIGRPDMTPHGCRDTYASWAISAGVPITIVSQSLGHANPSITLTFYAAYFPSDYDRLRDALAAIRVS